MGRSESVMVVAGEIDLNSVPGWREQMTVMLDGQPSVLVLDLAQVTFMDSMGLGLLVETRNRAAAQDARVMLRAIPQPVDRLLAISGLKDLF